MNLKSVLLLSAFAIVGSANAVTITSFSFENSTLGSSTPSSTGKTYSLASTGGLVAGTATGVHAAATTVYTSPAGNGSAKSFSSNTWAVGDYYQFQTSTLGYSALSISFDQAGSSTGPKNFKVQTSTNGTTFTDLAAGSYSVILSGFSSTSVNAAAAHTFSLTGVASSATFYVRLVDSSTTPISSGTAVAAGGTDRVDNFIVTGTQAVPEPTTMAVLGLGAVAMLRRRRSAK